MTHQEKNKWVIVFLVYADLYESTVNLNELLEHLRKKVDDKTIRELKSLYNDIVTTDTNFQVDILVIYNRVILKQSKNIHDTTYLLRAVPRKVNDTGRKRLKLIKRWDTNNMAQKPELLSDAFTIISEKFKSKHHILFTWDHGSIFGIFKEPRRNMSFFDVNIKYERVDQTAEDIVLLQRNRPFKRSWEQGMVNPRYRMPSCADIREPEEPELRDILTNEELASVINYWLPNRRLDVLVMMNCYMQNVNTAYALRNSVKYLVAPEGVINEPGYNYNAILRLIFRRSGVSPRKVAKKAVSSLKDLFYNEVFKKNINQWAVFAINLKKYYLLIDLIDELARLLIRKMKLDPNLKNQLFDIRKSFFPFDMGVSTYMVDLRNCILKFNLNLNFPQLDVIQAKLGSILKQISIKKFIGETVYEPNGRNYTDDFKPCGISIYFPKQKSDIEENNKIFYSFIVEGANSRSIFFTNTRWLTFVCEYVDLP